jgi:hypothetical protein
MSALKVRTPQNTTQHLSKLYDAAKACIISEIIDFLENPKSKNYTVCQTGHISHDIHTIILAADIVFLVMYGLKPVSAYNVAFFKMHKKSNEFDYSKKDAKMAFDDMLDDIMQCKKPVQFKDPQTGNVQISSLSEIFKTQNIGLTYYKNTSTGILLTTHYTEIQQRIEQTQKWYHWRFWINCFPSFDFLFLLSMLAMTAALISTIILP